MCWKNGRRAIIWRSGLRKKDMDQVVRIAIGTGFVENDDSV